MGTVSALSAQAAAYNQVLLINTITESENKILAFDILGQATC
jgi:hypothetical protein